MYLKTNSFLKNVRYGRELFLFINFSYSIKLKFVLPNPAKFFGQCSPKILVAMVNFYSWGAELRTVYLITFYWSTVKAIWKTWKFHLFLVLSWLVHFQFFNMMPGWSHFNLRGRKYGQFATSVCEARHNVKSCRTTHFLLKPLWIFVGWSIAFLMKGIIKLCNIEKSKFCI